MSIMSDTDEFQSSAVISMIPEILLDPAKTIQISRQNRWSMYTSLVEKLEQATNLCRARDQQLKELKMKREDHAKRLSKNIDLIKKEYYEKEVEENILRNEISSHKSILAKTVENAPDEVQLSELIRKMTEVKIEAENKKTRMKLELDQYRRGIKFYKKYLLCNVIYVPKETVIITLNLSAKSQSEVTDYIKFTTADFGKTFHYVEMQPSVEQEKYLVGRYQETNDIQAFILSFWTILREQKKKSILKEKN